MNAWELVIAYLVVFVLLQFVIYRYVRGDDEESPRRWGHVPNAEVGSRSDSSMEPDSSVDRKASVDRESALDTVTGTDLDDAVHADVDGGRACSNCGAKNATEPVYEYCRNCGGRLRR